jgi:hypothetical protein
MYKFHITGFVGFDKRSDQFISDCPVDITVYSDTVDNALDKAATIIGKPISTRLRKVAIEECRNFMEITY